MKKQPEHEPRTATHRIVTAMFGVFFVLLAIGILVWADESMFIGAVIAALVVGLLGIDGCVSAFRGKRSLLERIGPLP
jgi:uncharacterized membrane protein YdbT with pleckstrin-like domain